MKNKDVKKKIKPTKQLKRGTMKVEELKKDGDIKKFSDGKFG